MEQTSSPPVKIDQKIVGYAVVVPDKEPTAAPPPAEPAPLLYIEPKNYERPDSVAGATYKISPPTMSSALYITINNVVLESGKLRPIEVFVNTKDVEHFQWIAALTRVISALLRKPGDFLFLVDELLQVHDPKGGYWDSGTMVPSVVAHIGRVFKKHCESIGALQLPQLSTAQQTLVAEKATAASAKGITGTLCGKCGEMTVVLIDNCQTCLSCSDSKCG